MAPSQLFLNVWSDHFGIETSQTAKQITPIILVNVSPNSSSLIPSGVLCSSPFASVTPYILLVKKTFDSS